MAVSLTTGGVLGHSSVPVLRIVAFLSLFWGMELVSEEGVSAAWLVISGIFLGSLMWWGFLLSSVATVCKRLNSGAFQIIKKLSGGMIMGFSVYLLYGAYALWEAV